MARNQFIAQLYLSLCENGKIPADALQFAIARADNLEDAGCAPWQDAPPVEYQNSMIRSKMPQSPGQVIQFDLPARREITAADVQPGAVFVDEDEEICRVESVEGDTVFYRAYTANEDNTDWSISGFVEERNKFNATATATPPTA